MVNDLKRDFYKQLREMNLPTEVESILRTLKLYKRAVESADERQAAQYNAELLRMVDEFGSQSVMRTNVIAKSRGR
jgi:hypothetical protein